MEKDPSLITACTLEVDLDVPQMEKFHNYTNCNPPAPETKIIGKVPKLAPNLLNKRGYIVHHKALQYYLKNGLVLKRIRCSIRYEEKDYINSSNDLNTEMCTNAKNDFEVAFFKLANNAVFGTNLTQCGKEVILRL